MENILYLHAGAEMYGADKILLEMVVGIDKKRFNPIVVLPNYGILFEALKKNNIEVYVIDYPILRRKYFNPKGMLYYVLKYQSGVEHLYRMVRNKNIGIVHVNTMAVMEGVFLKKKLHVKLIWHIHELIIKPKIINFLLSMIIGKFSDKIIVVSQSVKEHLISTRVVPRKKVEVIYNGVQNKNIQSIDSKYLYNEFKLNNNSVVAGMIGRVNSWKGQNDFLDSTMPLLRKYHNLNIFLVGGVFSGEEWRMDKLLQKIKELPNNERIHLLDFRDDTDQLFNLFDIFVLPSVRPDPLPTVVLEAMSIGKPIVGYRHGGIAEMVKDNWNGLLVEPCDKKELTMGIDFLIKNKSKRKEFGINSQKRQRKMFSIDSFIDNIEKTYTSILNK